MQALQQLAKWSVYTTVILGFMLLGGMLALWGSLQAMRWMV